MRCAETTERVYDRLYGLLDPQAERALQQHLTNCAACREEAAGVEQLWEQLGQLEEEVPSDRMRARFYSALSSYQEETTGSWRRFLERLWPQRPALQAAVALATLVVGLFVGSRVGISPGAEQQIHSLRQEVRAISLSLLDHQSASERLRGVEWSRRSTPDHQVVNALLETVRHDANVNVRLAAVEALSGYLDRPRVGQELLAALEGQDSPVMLVTLAQLLLAAEVEGSDAVVEQMLGREELDPSVRQHLQEAMSLQG